MSDLINRQAAIDALNKMKIYRPLDSDRYVISDCLNKIVNLPSTQPEIIRCKECKYYRPSFCEIWSKFGTIQTRESGFCYMAEKRDDFSDHMNPPTT